MVETENSIDRKTKKRAFKICSVVQWKELICIFTVFTDTKEPLDFL